MPQQIDPGTGRTTASDRIFQKVEKAQVCPYRYAPGQPRPPPRHPIGRARAISGSGLGLDMG
jgi:hypothetical protein